MVALRGISRREESLILVTEYCPKGTLHLLLHSTAQSELDAFKLASWVRAIARGMLHLHTRKPPILHRDLKPANIFVGGYPLLQVLSATYGSCHGMPVL